MILMYVLNRLSRTGAKSFLQEWLQPRMTPNTRKRFDVYNVTNTDCRYTANKHFRVIGVIRGQSHCYDIP